MRAKSYREAVMIKSCLRAGLLAAVAAALAGFGADALADKGKNHQQEQNWRIQLGATGGNINGFGTDGVYAYCCSGTLGALAEDGSGNLYILSNNHVLARTNLPTAFEAPFFDLFPDLADVLLPYADENITHPGLIDQASVCTQDESDTVASLPYFVPIDFGIGTNLVDAAIAQIVSDAVDPSGAILDIGVPHTDPVSAVLDLKVAKSGRTTGKTSGTVIAVDVTVDVGYETACGSGDIMVARFVDQIAVRGRRGGFSSGGDSGSLIVTDDSAHHPVALLFAGGRTYTFANPIGHVLDALTEELLSVVTIVGVSGDPDPADEEPKGGGPPPGKGKNKSGVRPFEDGLAPGLEIASEVKARHEDRLFEIPGVVGTGVSVDEAGNPVIEVYVERAVSAVGSPIPRVLDGVPVRVVVTGPIRAY